jgi:hypothetical protein
MISVPKIGFYGLSPDVGEQDRGDHQSPVTKSMISGGISYGMRMSRLVTLGIIVGVLLVWGTADPQMKQGKRPVSEAVETDWKPNPSPEVTSAMVISVRVTGRPNNYRFSVGVRSPDEGCRRYADWWEVVSLEGKLIYRRILGHSHVKEQPFLRSGGPVAILDDTPVLVRAHMNPGGYGPVGLKGTVKDGFQEVELKPGFASELEKEPPQPSGCAF